MQELSISEKPLDSFNPRMMEDALSESSLTHTQIGKGHFVGELLRANFSQSVFDSGKYNLPLLAFGDMPEDLVTLGFILDADGEGTLNGCTIKSGSAVVFSENMEMHYRLAPGTHWVALLLRRDLLEKHDIDLPASSAAVLNSERPAALSLRCTFKQVHQLLHQSSSEERLVLDAGKLAISLQESILADYCLNLESVQISTAFKKHQAVRIVRTIADYFQSHYSEPVQIQSICAIASVSWRTVERAFMRVYGVSPKSFLTGIRLSQSRKQLLSRRQATIGQIALDCGFFHMGRFSQEYFSLYGELPSKTKGQGAHAFGLCD